MPKPPIPPETLDLLRAPNPAVVAVLLPGGTPMSVATWYLVEDDGTVLLNMDAERARVSWMREHPEVALTALKEGEWYTHVSVRGRVVRWEDDEATALADIDRLAVYYTGQQYRVRDRPRVSCWVEVEHWHGWGAARAD
ncbi:pyridoxamine 5'-phosphate oxidase family protein [Phycicoccus flavus]|uniref:pyridoxamine 5'-phosphate oxidase family protein n=1 Tax=Phycicoccus flavus TaxID=2502783 RepID=UPI000FEBC08E|nr:pyridoxamine 5'-phosphate oxidase family protein [Phycicoccus flavus]NHA68552.1 PPOX class F420-dependent oxidoreductase [Phycicoccus flavus]